MATLSLREAAEQVNVSKSTIFRAIKNGRLSAGRTEDGGFAIDPAELFRVYPPVAEKQPDNVAAGQAAPAPATPGVETAVLEEQIRSLRETLRRADEQIEDLKRDRDTWRDNAQQAQRLLVDHRPKTFWQRLRRA